MRTQAEILAQCEARYAQLEAQYEEMKRKSERSCATCRFGSGLGDAQKCREPLVVGFDKRGFKWAWDCNDFSQHQSALCGPEKALWQPKLKWWQKLIANLG